MNIINARRLRDYPRLMFITTWIILAINLIFRQGWLGGLNQIIGSDFITLYAAGLIYRTDLPHLYDLSTQFAIQQSLIQPTNILGVNPYISPPYVAQAYSLFTYTSLPIAFILWTVLSLIFAFLAVYLCHSVIQKSLPGGLNLWQLVIIVFSFFPFIEGLQVGQNNTLTLLLVTSLLVFTLSDHWFPAGIMAGLMIYKPQLVIGFLVIWIVWRKYKALGGFAITSFLWIGSFVIFNGIEPYKIYLNMSRELLVLPYQEGFPGYLLTTLFGFFSSVFPIQSLPVINLLTFALTFIFLILIVWLAYRYRNKPILEATPLLTMAIILPILVSPYTLLHDMLILVPAFILWQRYSSTRILLYVAIGVYLGCFFLTLVVALTKIALLPFISLGLIVLVILWILNPHRKFALSENQ